MKYTLETAIAPPKCPETSHPQVPLQLPPDLGNLTTMMAAAGRHPVYKGKFHLTRRQGSKWVPADV